MSERKKENSMDQKLSDKIEQAIKMVWPPDIKTLEHEWLPLALEPPAAPKCELCDEPARYCSERCASDATPRKSSDAPAAIGGVVEEMQKLQSSGLEPNVHEVDSWITQLRAAMEQGEALPCDNCDHPGDPCPEYSGCSEYVASQPAPESADTEKQHASTCKLGPGHAIHGGPTPPPAVIIKTPEPADGELLPCPLPGCGARPDSTYPVDEEQGVFWVGCSADGCQLNGAPMPVDAWQSLPRRSHAVERLHEVARVAQIVVDEMIDIGPHGGDLLAALEALNSADKLAGSGGQRLKLPEVLHPCYSCQAHAVTLDGTQPCGDKDDCGKYRAWTSATPEPSTIPKVTPEVAARLRRESDEAVGVMEGKVEGLKPRNGPRPDAASLADEMERSVADMSGGCDSHWKARDVRWLARRVRRLQPEPAKVPGEAWVEYGGALGDEVVAVHATSDTIPDGAGCAFPFHGAGKGGCEGCEARQEEIDLLEAGCESLEAERDAARRQSERDYAVRTEAIAERDAVRAELEGASHHINLQIERAEKAEAALETERQAHEETRRGLVGLVKQVNAYADRVAALESGPPEPPRAPHPRPTPKKTE
jgi:hypothetical protein